MIEVVRRGVWAVALGLIAVVTVSGLLLVPHAPWPAADQAGGAAAGWLGGSRGGAVFAGLSAVHRVSSRALLPVLLVTLLVWLATSASRRRLVLIGALVVTVPIAAFFGALLPSTAVTRIAGSRVIMLDSVEIGLQTYVRWYVLHLVVGAAVVALSLLAMAPRRRNRQDDRHDERLAPRPVI